MSRLERLLAAYRDHVSIPIPSTVAPIQRVVFLVYDKEDELRLRACVTDFEQATVSASKRWHLIDLTHAFPTWLATQEYREAYFESPEDLDGYPAGEVSGFVADTIAGLKAEIEKVSDPETVVALLGVGALFGLARVSTLIEGVKDSVAGRLLVFFPGEHHPETHAYRLLDARDGWNYLALPITADPIS